MVRNECTIFCTIVWRAFFANCIFICTCNNLKIMLYYLYICTLYIYLLIQCTYTIHVYIHTHVHIPYMCIYIHMWHQRLSVVIFPIKWAFAFFAVHEVSVLTEPTWCIYCSACLLIHRFVTFVRLFQSSVIVSLWSFVITLVIIN